MPETEIELGRIRKSPGIEIVIRKTEYKGLVGVDIREYITGERYTGWSKSGIKIPMAEWENFLKIVNNGVAENQPIPKRSYNGDCRGIMD